MYEELKDARGYICIFMDDGIWGIPSPAAKGITANAKDTFFPYGSIKKIRLGGILGVMEIIGTQGEKEKSYMYVSDKEERPRIKELIKFAQSKIKTAPRADYIEKDFKHPNKDAEQFYNECNKLNLYLTNNSLQADIERAKLVAMQNGLNIPANKVVETYLLGESEIARTALNEYYENLFTQAKEAERYTSYHGRDKDILVAQGMVDFYNAKWEYLALGKALPVQKEHDWALMGGIASGLAGGAAGVAVASDLQMKNAAIRAYNDQLRKDYAKVILPSLTEVLEIKNVWEKKLEKAKLALVDDSSQEKLFQSISFSEVKAQILDNCSVVVTAEATIPYVKIFETVTAQIDGTLTAVVSQNGKVIGEALMVIPQEGQEKDVNGTIYTKYLLVGACSDKAEKDVACEIVIQPRDLWAIER